MREEPPARNQPAEARKEGAVPVRRLEREEQTVTMGAKEQQQAVCGIGDVAPPVPERSRAVSRGRLSAVLEKHQAWVGSGWEIGKRADLHGADLHGQDLHGVILSDADLHRADLHRAALRGADLDGADLHRADLHRADLRAADLQSADLHEADLHGADLRGAVLREADLHRADLHDADLQHADLKQADLRGANLRRVRGLSRHQLCEAETDATTLLPHLLES
jgi:uncharacterized protein YjbI with pentapeptide repeats